MKTRGDRELYTLTEKDVLYACVILNSKHEEKYDTRDTGDTKNHRKQHEKREPLS